MPTLQLQLRGCFPAGPHNDFHKGVAVPAYHDLRAAATRSLDDCGSVELFPRFPVTLPLPLFRPLHFKPRNTRGLIVALRPPSLSSGVTSEFREKIVYKVPVQAPSRGDRASYHHLHLHAAGNDAAPLSLMVPSHDSRTQGTSLTHEWGSCASPLTLSSADSIKVSEAQSPL